MALTDENLISERNSGLSGTHRIYRLGNYGLSLINGLQIHSYPFAWEAAVLKFDGDQSTVIYDTPLTDCVEVFFTEEEAIAFIEKAFAWFGEQMAVQS